MSSFCSKGIVIIKNGKYFESFSCGEVKSELLSPLDGEISTIRKN